MKPELRKKLWRTGFRAYLENRQYEQRYICFLRYNLWEMILHQSIQPSPTEASDRARFDGIIDRCRKTGVTCGTPVFPEILFYFLMGHRLKTRRFRKNKIV